MRYHHCEQQGLPFWIYEELRSIQEVSHRYGDEESPEELAETFAEEMAPEYGMPPERLLDGSDLLFEYKPELIQVRVYCLIFENYDRLRDTKKSRPSCLLPFVSSFVEYSGQLHPSREFTTRSSVYNLRKVCRLRVC